MTADRKKLYLHLGLGVGGVLVAYYVIDGVLGAQADLVDSQADLEQSKNWTPEEISSANSAAVAQCVEDATAQAETNWDNKTGLSQFFENKNKFVSEETDRILASNDCLELATV
jgi:hypothetical protein